jgi:hypothetical protein
VLDLLRLDRPVALVVALFILVGSVALIVILSRFFRTKKPIQIRNEYEEKDRPKDGEMKP